MVINPLVVAGEEPVSSMGTDTPIAVLSERPQLLFKYFKQLFAQVTNPPIDPIREELVMSLVTSIGPKPNVMAETPEACRRIKVLQPILTTAHLEKIRQIADPHFKSKTLRMLFRVTEGPDGLGAAVDNLCRQASDAIKEGYKFLILSDRGVNEEWAPIPSLLGISAVHHHLVRECTRTEVGLILETGEPRDVHHFACLIGYGAGTINPYLVFETLVDMERDGYLPEGLDAITAETKFIKAINKGLLKIFSKMGISTVQSYCGAQIFEAIGLNHQLVDRYFTGTASRIEGIGIRASEGDRQTVYDWRHVLRRDQQRSPRDPGRRYEPAGRQEQHRGRRRGPGTVRDASKRRFQEQCHQAGGLGALRGHDRLPGSCQ